MPSLPFKSRKKDSDQDNVTDHKNPNPLTGDRTPPPAYAEAPQHGGSPVGASAPTATGDVGADITAAFSNLSLDPGPTDPTVEKCLAHLKLLHAFQSMKEDVGYTDGLWDIWDSRAESGGDIDIDDVQEPLRPGTTEPISGEHKRSHEDDKKIRLSKIREKRWALFLARAVDRYEAWWATFTGRVMLREKDMVEGSGSTYPALVLSTNIVDWTETMLPPLDVLMV